jgi:hypothetical protein
VGDFEVISHVQGQKLTVSARGASGSYELQAGSETATARNLNQALEWALERVRQSFAKNLDRPREQLWGVRVVTPCGTFQVGNWSFEPLSGGGGGFAPGEGILAVFRDWEQQARANPAAAVAGARKVVSYCLGR